MEFKIISLVTLIPIAVVIYLVLLIGGVSIFMESPLSIINAVGVLYGIVVTASLVLVEYIIVKQLIKLINEEKVVI